MSRLPIHVYHGHAERMCERIRSSADPGRQVIALVDPDQLTQAMPDLHVLFAPMPPRNGWADAGQLRLIQMFGAGVDQLLPSADLPDRVEVAGVRGVFAAEVAEHAIGMMVALSRKLPQLLELQANKVFDQRSTDALHGKTVMLLGLGEIGRRIARVARALDMSVVGVSKRGRPVDGIDDVVAVADLPSALARADHLIVALPHTAETAGLIGPAEIAALPAGAFIINVARGGIVDEGALLEGLTSGHLAGAASDVFDEEPLPSSSPLWQAPNLIITPHLAGYGRDYTGRCIGVLLDNVRRLERGEPLRCLVDRSLGY